MKAIVRTVQVRNHSPMAALAGGAGSAVAGVTGLIGSLVASKRNLKAQRETNAINAQLQREINAQNLQINQMNNDFNAREAQLQRDFQLGMWNRENEYNTASAQRARLEEAGLNPYLMMSGGSAGTAGSAGASSSAATSAGNAQMVAPHIQAPQYDMSFVSNSLQGMMQPIQNWLVAMSEVDKNKSETQKNIDLTPVYAALLNAQALQAKGDTKWEYTNPAAIKWLQENGGVAANVRLETQKQQLKNLELAGALTNADIAQRTVSTKAQEIINDYLPAQQQSELWLKSSIIFQNYAAGNLSFERAKTEITQQLLNEARTDESKARRRLTDVQTKRAKLDYRVAAETADEMIKAMNMANFYDRLQKGYEIPYLERHASLRYKKSLRDYRLSLSNSIFKNIESLGRGVGALIPF